jgi:hypothetical protein
MVFRSALAEDRLFGNRRGSTRIWGCVGGYAAYTPPNPGIITVNPNDPEDRGSLWVFVHGKIVVRTRASPSGKASAFQADIRGSESRRPLWEYVSGVKCQVFA